MKYLPSLRYFKRHKSTYRILGIESTCDDTGVAICDTNGQFLSNVLKSQLKFHLNTGGIIPALAKELHLNAIDQVANQSFLDSKLKSFADDIDAIAVSNRPGLGLAIEVGLNYAKTLAKKYSKPLIPIHHMQAHALIPLHKYKDNIKFPFIALLISGGHSLIAIVTRFNKFCLIGSAEDIALGDILDKYGRRLRLKDLGHPFDEISGGASIEILASQKTADMFKYFDGSDSLTMLRKMNCDMNFSGFSSRLDSLSQDIDKMWQYSSRDALKEELSHICASFQRAVCIQIVRKLHQCISYYLRAWRYENMDQFSECEDEKHLSFGIRHKDESEKVDIVISGGCAANKFFVETVRNYCQSSSIEQRVFSPDKELCSDNGAMIAWNGALRYIDHKMNPELYPKEDLNQSVIYDSLSIDSLDFMSKCEIGESFRDRMLVYSIPLPPLKEMNFPRKSRSQ